MNRVWDWIDKIKNEDNGLVSFLKWCYSIGKISWIHAVISAAAGILIPIFLDKAYYKSMAVAIIVAILDILYAYICNEYQKKLFISRKFTSESQSLWKKKQQYYSYQIFVNNNKGMNILEAKEIQNKSIWYKNPENNVDVKRYIGIAVSVLDDEKVNFILQIDFLDEFKFGKHDSEEEIKNFVDQYLLSYVNIVTLAYLLNLNSKKELNEV